MKNPRGRPTDLEDYTKFRLKKKERLIPLLEHKENLFVIACNKCFKEFTAGYEPEIDEFAELAADHGKTLTGCINIDFLCNKTITDRQLTASLPPQTENIFVISCGLGVQTVADLSGQPVYAACDSYSFGGRHGMALTRRLCEACGQCYLNYAGGVCPIVDCSKSLVNGQCGGSKNGKCETDKDKDCAWVRIFDRLDTQNRTDVLLSQPALLRDYSKINYKLINGYVKAIREKRLEGCYGGVHPSERKDFSNCLPLKRFPAPDKAAIPLLQHAGAPARPLVKTGDHVLTGQKIGEAAGFISSTIHASISGVVTAVEPRRYPYSENDIMTVVIESDGDGRIHDSVEPLGDLSTLTPDGIVELIREKGIVGMGGAAFPASVKLKPPKPVDTILINGCECEPLLTADHRVMLEYADDVILGLQALLKATGADKGVIVIEDNKSDAIKLLESKTAGFADIGIIPAKTKYPQGAEKMLIKRALGRHVPGGALPFEVGVIVSNVSTVKAVSDALLRGMPLIERVVTVTGEKIRNPGNYIVKIGTSVKDIIDYCGGVTDDNAIIKLGGPMMGVQIDDLNIPIIKGTNGIIAVEPPVSEPSACIRCGRCADVCPMELLPLYYPQYADKANWEGMKDKAVKDCIECGCCDYICPSKIAIRDAIKLGKKKV